VVSRAIRRYGSALISAKLFGTDAVDPEADSPDADKPFPAADEPYQAANPDPSSLLRPQTESTQKDFVPIPKLEKKLFIPSDSLKCHSPPPINHKKKKKKKRVSPVPAGKLSNSQPEISSESGNLFHSQTFPFEKPLESSSFKGKKPNPEEFQEHENLISSKSSSSQKVNLKQSFPQNFTSNNFNTKNDDSKTVEMNSSLQNDYTRSDNCYVFQKNNLSKVDRTRNTLEETLLHSHQTNNQPTSPQKQNDPQLLSEIKKTIKIDNETKKQLPEIQIVIKEKTPEEPNPLITIEDSVAQSLKQTQMNNLNESQMDIFTPHIKKKTSTKKTKQQKTGTCG
jgi:hypothetical protein